ncbi:unnamed protein product [Closterium sp. NIES-64]|nr:unnamed protein product [Closterium sp. NIES-64]
MFSTSSLDAEKARSVGVKEGGKKGEQGEGGTSNKQECKNSGEQRGQEDSRSKGKGGEREEYESMDEENLGWRSHWGFKLIVAATIVGVAINAFPLMGDSLIRHSVALLRAKDPFLRRSGAYRLAFIASNGELQL